MTRITVEESESVKDQTDKAFRSALVSELQEQEQKARRSARRWNGYYYAFLFGSVLFAASAAVLPKIDSLSPGFWKNDMPPILAGLSAMLTTAMHAGSFERRWQASRARKARTQEVRIQLLDPEVDLRNVSERLRDVITTYHQEVLGATGGSPQPKINRNV